ncbi:Predicted transcriptional regulator [uncultured Eubacterium sp.]|nr:Predicted transcriptional regulator [uncultured Eubacterium sp.]
MGVKKKLEVLMQENGLNASKLAEKAGLPKSTVYTILKRDSSNIGYETTAKLCSALNCSPSDFLEDNSGGLDFFTELKDYIEKNNTDIKRVEKQLEDLESHNPSSYRTLELKSELSFLQFIDDLLHEKQGVFLNTQGMYLGERDIYLSVKSFWTILMPYLKLNAKGREVAEERVSELALIEKYRKEK